MNPKSLITMVTIFTILLISVFELSSCGPPPYFQFIEKGIEKPRLGHVCSGDEDCEFVNSECSGEQCVCIDGFEWSMHHADDTCVPGILYLTTDYHLNGLHWTDQLKHKESREYGALLNRLETNMQAQNDLIIDLPEANFDPSDDGKVVATLGYHMKNPMVIKTERQTRETHQPERPRINRRDLYRNSRDLSGFLDALIADIETAASDLGYTITGLTATLENGPLGEYCNGDCGIEHSSCISHICRCNVGYAHIEGDDDTCHPRVDLGGRCTDDAECYENQECSIQSCSCEAGNVEIDDGTQCGPAVGLDGQCTDDLQCSTLGSACFGTCLCTSGPRDGSTCSGATTPPPPPCGTTIGAQCDVECPCEVPNTICTDSACVCVNTHVEYRGECVERVNHGQPCDHDIQCPNLGICDTNCVCSNEAVLVTGEGCVALVDIGEACDYEEQCTANAECNTTCQCIEDFAKSYKVENTCVPDEITVHLVISVGTYHANMATSGSSEYDAQLAALGDLLLTADSTFLRIENLVITDNGGTALNEFDAAFTNSDTVNPEDLRVRRNVLEPFSMERLQQNIIRAARDLFEQPLQTLQVDRK